MDSNELTVSVVIPTFNASKTIKMSIASILNQTKLPTEIVVVDNMSTDDTIHRINEIARDSIVPITVKFCNQKGSGPTRNLGVRACGGKWIAFLDSDDQWLPTKLEEQLKLHQGRKKFISGTYAQYINPSGKRIGTSYIFKSNSEAIYQIYNNFRLPVVLSSWIILKEDFEALTGFNPEFEVAQDFELFFRALKNGYSVGILQKNLVKYHISETSISTSRYIDQYLSAQFVISHQNSEDLSVHQFISDHKTSKSALHRRALSGYFLRKALSASGPLRSFTQLKFALASAVIDPGSFTRKVKRHTFLNSNNEVNLIKSINQGQN